MKQIPRMLTIARTGGLLLSLAAWAADAQSLHSANVHPADQASNASGTPADATQMQKDLADLRNQIRVLEQQVQSSAPAVMEHASTMGSMQPRGKPMAQAAKPAMQMGAMSQMDDDDSMSMQKQKDAKSGGSTSMSSGGMEMDMMKMMQMMRPMMGGDGMMGSKAMGGMNSPVAMAMPSALPGFPGQSHLYHVGATGFFFDHPEHITLATQQQKALAQRKQQSLIKQGEVQRQIDAAEQELWQLTGADQPQIAQIEKKVREIERLRADQRVAFIRAVGEAAKVLTDEQRRQLTGMAPAQSTMEQAPMQMPDNSKPKDMEHM